MGIQKAFLPNLAALALFALSAPHVRSEELRPIPALTGPVMDEANLLRGNELASLDSELRSYPPKIQLQIWIVNSLNGEAIEALSIRAVDTWKLGTKKEDRGALLLIAVADRKMRIEVGQGLEGEIPDITAGRIVRQILGPSFKSGNFYEGILRASRAMYAAAGGDANALPEVGGIQRDERVPRGGAWDAVSLVFLFLFGFIFIILSAFRRRRYWGGGGGYWGGGGGFGGGGWSGGGGSWGGGGGGFSGGGSSGNW